MKSVRKEGKYPKDTFGHSCLMKLMRGVLHRILAVLLIGFSPFAYSRAQTPIAGGTPPSTEGFSSREAQVSVDRGPHLYSVKVGEKRGYIDASGKMIIEPRFEEATGFWEGLAVVKLDGRYGFIDPTGSVAIQPRFEAAEQFADGLASVKIGEKWGFVNRAGEMAISARFDSVGVFSEGLATIKIGDKAGFIDQVGKLVIEPQYEVAWGFSEGLSAVEVDGKSGYINRRGQMIIPAQFRWGERFSEGLAFVITEEWKLRFIDRTGKTIIKVGTRPTAQWIRMGLFFGDAVFEEGLAAAPFGNKWGFIDKKRKKVIRPRYVSVSPFSEGLAAVAVFAEQPGGGVKTEWGYVDRKGKMVIPPRFETASQFENGVARVTVAGETGYIDRQGRYIWRPLPTKPSADEDEDVFHPIVKPRPEEPGEQRRAWMIGHFAGELTSETGEVVRWLVERTPDGKYATTFRRYAKGGGYEDQVEVGYWGISGPVYFTITVGWLREDGLEEADPTSAYFYDAYRIVHLDGQSIECEDFERRQSYKVERVDEDFVLPE